METSILIGVIGILGYVIRRYFAGGICKSKNRLDGKVVIITGANTGIGKETALELAKRGAYVILACRNLKLAQNAADEIKLKTIDTKVDVEELKLDDLRSVRDFAKRMNSKLTRLDILVNNAGVMMCPFGKTIDGFETQFGVNHLGHFLLTNLLIDLLKKSAPSRIVNVSSIAHTNGKINWDDINFERGYSPLVAYSQSKLANILFTLELSNRLKDTSITSVSLHPGAVRTELLRHVGDSVCFLIPYIEKLLFPLMWLTWKSPREGAQTTLHCCLDDSITNFNGKYFSDCKPKKPTKEARDRDASKRLWELSEKLVELRKDE